MATYSSEMIEGAIRACRNAGWSENLSLWDTHLSDSDLKLLSQENGVHLLKSLELIHAVGISNAGLRYVGNLSGLSFLNLAMIPITDDGLKHLASLPSLSSFLLQTDGITDNGIKHLAAIPTLNMVALAGCRLTGSCCKHLARLPSLSKLHLGGKCMEIVDEDCRHIGRLTGLRDLKLITTQIFGDGLKDLHGLKLLECITFYESLWLSDVIALEPLLPPGGSLRKIVVHDRFDDELPAELLEEGDAAKIIEAFRQLKKPVPKEVQTPETPPEKMQDETSAKAPDTERQSAIEQTWAGIGKDDQRLCLAMLEIISENPVRMDSLLKELKSPKRSFQCFFHRSRIYARVAKLIEAQFVIRVRGIHKITDEGAEALRLYLPKSDSASH